MFNRHEFPAGGGWTFRQPQTGWTNPFAMVGFKASVDAILKHRLANPAITAKHKLSTDLVAIGDELEKYTRLRLGLPESTAPSFFHRSSSQLSGEAVAAVTNIRRAAQGTAVILDWLTSGGKPVESDLAVKRASICAACPKNVKGSWYTVAPAELIRATLSSRSDLKLETPFDDKLESCDVCKCLMRLKVWTPLDFILNKTRPEILAAFPPHCWIARKDQ